MVALGIAENDSDSVFSEFRESEAEEVKLVWLVSFRASGAASNAYFGYAGEVVRAVR